MPITRGSSKRTTKLKEPMFQIPEDDELPNPVLSDQEFIPIAKKRRTAARQKRTPSESGGSHLSEGTGTTDKKHGMEKQTRSISRKGRGSEVSSEFNHSDTEFNPFDEKIKEEVSSLNSSDEEFTPAPKKRQSISRKRKGSLSSEKLPLNGIIEVVEKRKNTRINSKKKSEASENDKRKENTSSFLIEQSAELNLSDPDFDQEEEQLKQSLSKISEKDEFSDLIPSGEDASPHVTSKRPTRSRRTKTSLSSKETRDIKLDKTINKKSNNRTQKGKASLGEIKPDNVGSLLTEKTSEVNLTDSDFENEDCHSKSISITKKIVSASSSKQIFSSPYFSPTKGTEQQSNVNWDVLLHRLENKDPNFGKHSDAMGKQEDTDFSKNLEVSKHEEQHVDEEDEDWEDVDVIDQHHHHHSHNEDVKNDSSYVIPQSVEIVISKTALSKTAKKLSTDELLKRQLNRHQREHQETLHRIHVMTLYSHARLWNRYCCQPLLQAVLMSRFAHITQDMPALDGLSFKHVTSLIESFRTKYGAKFPSLHDDMIYSSEYDFKVFEKSVLDGKTVYQHYQLFHLVLLLRSLGIPTRIVLACKPIVLKPDVKVASFRAPQKEKYSNPSSKKKGIKRKHSSPSSSDKHSSDCDFEEPLCNLIRKKANNKTKGRQTVKKGEQASSSHSAQDDIPQRPKRKSPQVQEEEESKENPTLVLRQSSFINKGSRKVISPDINEHYFLFCEFYLLKDDKWYGMDWDGVAHADIRTHLLNPPNPLEKSGFVYLFGFDERGCVKDLTSKFDPFWSGCHRKLRIKEEWLNRLVEFRQRKVMPPLTAVQEAAAKCDKEETEKILRSTPPPKSLGEFKCHPLYALRRHLLKYEVIYPDDQEPIATVSNEAVYPRSAVKICHTKETWIKEAIAIKKGERPAKLVKAVLTTRRKLLQRDDESTPMVQLYGEWQTEPYDPPPAENGRVPRNEYGNVDLYKLSMLPKGCKYLKLPGLGRVANKVGLDAAEAVTGWEFHPGGWAHPVKEGWIVCEEHADILIDAWKENWREEKRKEVVKRQQRVWTNWKRIIKILLIRARLRSKYEMKETPEETSYVSSIAKGMQAKMKFLEEQSKGRRRTK